MTGFTIKSIARTSSEEAYRVSWLGTFFRSLPSSLPLSCDIFQQTGGPYQQVATALPGGSHDPWPPANESQGLKIAVAAFVTLTVALAVTSYFLYSAYSRSEAQLESERDKLTKAQKVASDAVNQYDEFRKLAGAGPRSSTRPRPRSARSSRRIAIASIILSLRPMPPSRRPSKPAPRARTSRKPGPASRRSSTPTRASPTRTSFPPWTGSPSCSKTSAS